MKLNFSPLTCAYRWRKTVAVFYTFLWYRRCRIVEVVVLFAGDVVLCTEKQEAMPSVCQETPSNKGFALAAVCSSLAAGWCYFGSCSFEGNRLFPVIHHSGWWLVDQLRVRSLFKVGSFVASSSFIDDVAEWCVVRVGEDGKGAFSSPIQLGTMLSWIRLIGLLFQSW